MFDTRIPQEAAKPVAETGLRDALAQVGYGETSKSVRALASSPFSNPKNEVPVRVEIFVGVGEGFWEVDLLAVAQSSGRFGRSRLTDRAGAAFSERTRRFGREVIGIAAVGHLGVYDGARG